MSITISRAALALYVFSFKAVSIIAGRRGTMGQAYVVEWEGFDMESLSLAKRVPWLKPYLFAAIRRKTANPGDNFGSGSV
jgi:hypothetical protein